MNKVISFKYALLFALLTSTILSTSCNRDEEEPEEEEPSTEVPVTFGIRHDKSLTEYETVGRNNAPYNTAEYPDFGSVVAFSYSLDGSDNNEYVATGTLLNDEWILTAGHNFYVAEEQANPAPAAGIDILIGDDPNSPVATMEVAELVFHPTWIEHNKDFLNANDLCLVKVKGSITGHPYAEYNDANANAIGNVAWFCGYGDYSQTEGQDKNSFSKRHAIENVLDRANDGISTTSNGETHVGGLVAFDFDDPSGKINSLGDDVVNADEKLLGDGTSQADAKELEGATVQGDSGGPLFVKIGSEWKLVGVLSGGANEPIAGHKDGSYGDISIFTRVSTHADWIKSVIK